MQALPALRPHAAQLRIRTSVRRLWELTPLRWMLYPTGAACVLRLLGKPHSELPCLCKVEGGEGGSCKASARAQPQANMPLLKLSGPVHLPSRGTLARGGITSSEGGVSSRLRRTHPTTHTLIPLLIRPGRRPRSPQLPPPGRRPGLKNLSSNPQQPLNGLLGSLRRKQLKVSKPRHPNPQHPAWLSPPIIPPPHSRISQIFSITFLSTHVWS